jgi:hypothetical protein
MERNLLEREIAALNSPANFFINLQTEAEIKIYPSKFSGKLTEIAYLREEDLKKVQTTSGKKLYFQPNQRVDVLGENGDWFLVEGDAFYKDRNKEKTYSVNNTPVKQKGWIKKSWLIYKIPAKLDEEPNAGNKQTKGYTCYVEIDLNLKASTKNKAWAADRKNNFKPTAWVSDFPEPMTAIFVPDSFKPEAETDLIIYLHGHLKDHPGLIDIGKGKFNSPSIQKYLNYSKKPYFDFREIINKSKKNIIFVAPTLGPRSQYGNLAKTFDNYIDQVIWAVNQYIFKARQLNGKLNLGNLIIAAHSGGGSPMLSIAEQSKSIYAQRIKSFWGFDSWYQSSNSWSKAVRNIIKNNQPVTIHAYTAGTAGYPKPDNKTAFVTYAKQEPKLKGTDLHFTLLPFYFEERLRNL